METIKLNGDIIHIVTDEESRNYKWEKNADKLDRNLQIISIDDMNTAQTQGLYSFVLSGTLSPGMVLAKHPFLQNRYIDINKAENIIFQDKLNHMSEIARLLGATSIEAKAVFEKEEEMEISASGELTYKVVSANAQYEKEEKKRYAELYERKEEFSGDFARESYKKAREKARQYGLLEESDIQHLLRQRNPDELNPIWHISTKTEMANELNSLLKCAMSLKILPGVFTLGGDIKKSISIRKRVTLETYLDFKKLSPVQNQGEL